jgi:hypothetical protein
MSFRTNTYLQDKADKDQSVMRKVGGQGIIPIGGAEI